MRGPTLRLVLLIILAALIAPGYPGAVSRGIRVVSKAGKKLELYKDYHAVVVGVSEYEKWPDLPYAVKDAQEVSELLKRLGFKVRLVTDPNSQELKRALSTLAYSDGREPNRALILYYAGHGETETLADGTKLGYLIPRDCPLLRDDPQGFINRDISMKEIGAYSLRIRSKHVLMLFDSCFSGSLFSLVRAVPEDISEKSAFPVRQYITAGREDEAVPDRSMFKRCLVLGLQGDADLTRDGYITGSELGLYLSDKVVKYTKGRQHPQYGKINNPDLDRGDFVFIVAKSSGAIIEKPARPEKKATLRINANISGARVYLDGVDKGMAPVTIDDIRPGRYRVKVAKEGYEPYEERVLVSPGKDLEVRALLERIVTMGSISISGSPKGARVYLDGYYAGVLPCTLEQVEAGVHSIKVKKRGFKDWEERVRLRAGQALSLTADLRPVQIGPGKTFTNSIGMKFAYIPPGTFMMGSPPNEKWRDDDETQHRITLTKGFYLQTTEVTVGQWRSFARDTGYKSEAETGGGAWVLTGKKWSKKKGYYWDNPGFSQTESHPVTCVSWNDVQAFIEWLSQKEGKNYRLPTGAEWEYACRAGSTTAFANGDIIEAKCGHDPNLNEMGWYCGNSSRKTHPVAQKNPNSWGLYDMHGNVWEWCRDWYGKYPSGRITDPEGPSSGSYRVIRGGSWSSHARSCRSANRFLFRPGYRDHSLGFRLAIGR